MNSFFWLLLDFVMVIEKEENSEGKGKGRKRREGCIPTLNHWRKSCVCDLLDLGQSVFIEGRVE